MLQVSGLVVKVFLFLLYCMSYCFEVLELKQKQIITTNKDSALEGESVDGWVEQTELLFMSTAIQKSVVSISQYVTYFF